MGHAHGKHKAHRGSKHKGDAAAAAAAAAEGAGKSAAAAPPKSMPANATRRAEVDTGHPVEMTVTGHYSKLRDVYDIAGTEIGSGHYGHVFVGTHKELGRKDAIKVIPKKNVKNIKNLQNEIKIMKELQGCKYIVNLFEVFEDYKNLYLAMELCDGGELFYNIQQAGSYNEQDACCVMVQLFKALVFCHSHNVCHRDLKPENFLLKRKGDIHELKVIDFGLSRIFHRGERMHSKAGTPYYIAPEVLAKDYDTKCDMWSAGVIMYILMCGYPPFWGDNNDEVYEAVTSGDFDYDDPAWDKVSEGPGSARELIDQLLCLDPESRPSAVEALKHPWVKSHTNEEEDHAPHVDHPWGDLPQMDNNKMFDRMIKYTAQNRLKKVVKRTIAQMLSETEIRKLFDEFKKVDTDGVGYLTVAELSKVLDAMGHHSPLKMVEGIMEGIDIDHTGKIGYLDLCAATLSSADCLNEDKLHNAFERLDHSSGGGATVVKKSDLRAVLEGTPEGVVVDILNKVGVAGDAGDDEPIDYEKFKAMMESQEASGSLQGGASQSEGAGAGGVKG